LAFLWEANFNSPLTAPRDGSPGGAPGESVELHPLCPFVSFSQSGAPVVA
jgi:hypothetical protein